MVVEAKSKRNIIQTFIEVIAFCLQVFEVFNKKLMRKLGWNKGYVANISYELEF
jgi:hypothetical protein